MRGNLLSSEVCSCLHEQTEGPSIPVEPAANDGLITNIVAMAVVWMQLCGT